MRLNGIDSWDWLPNGELRTRSKVIPAISNDGRTSQKLFFNAIVAVYTGWNDQRNKGPDSVHFGDGSPLPEADVLRVDAIMQEIAVAVPWLQGDFVVIDNFLTQHSRRPFTLPRRILAYLFQ